MSDKVRVAIVGVGNCASSLVQGVQYYADAPDDAIIPGIMHANLGGYRIRDIEFTCGFDVDAEKVGKDISEAIFSGPNNTIKFADVPHLNAPVYRGPVLDGLGTYLTHKITPSDDEVADAVRILKETKTDIVVNYLPVGSQEATEWYAQAAIEAGCAFVNAMPVFIATTPEWAERFRQAGVPVLGDDVKSQVGATILHRVLVNLMNMRGVVLERTSQLNVGGNTDFYNMLDRSRLASKKTSKTNAVVSQLPYDVDDDNVYIGPSDYVPWLEDRKWAYIRMEGRTFGDVPLNIELKLEVVDSPNSAGVIIDAIRCAKLALDRGLAGPIDAPSSYFFKSPPIQPDDDTARRLLEAFIAGEDVETPAPSKVKSNGAK